jgi:polyisoprenoid-binding protein YceI
MKKILLIPALSALLLTSGAADAANLKLDPAKSKITFQFSQLGVPMQGRFTRFSAEVFFDARKPDATKAKFAVDINSVDLGAADYNAETRKPVWLDGGKFPTAHFEAEQVTATGPSSFEATGKLSIKGMTQPIKAQFNFTDGPNPVVDGRFTMKRLAWHIGDGEWKDTSVVADEVLVKFSFATSK